MLCLRKLWVAHYHEKGQKNTFASAIILADNYDQAEFRATEWAEQKWPNRRISRIAIEKSKKGEVVCQLLTS